MAPENSAGAEGGTGGDGEQVADGGEAPVLQGQAERDAGEQQGGGAERDGPERMQWGRGRVGEPPRHRHGQSRHAAVEGDIDGDANQGTRRGHAARV